MAISEKTRITYSAVTLGAVAVVTGVFLVGALLPFPPAILEQYTVAKTTTAVEQAVVADEGEYIKKTDVIAAETTPHGDTHGFAVDMIPKTLALAAMTSGIPWNEIWAGDHEFYPTRKTVPVGTTVTWINKEGLDHTVTEDTGLFDYGLIPGITVSYTFDKPGVYEYFCQPHDGMAGQITVTANTTPAAKPAPAAAANKSK